MNTQKQFWTLIKFQTVVSPFALMVPIAFCMPLYFMWQRDLALSFLVQNQNFFLIWLFGALLLAPELFTSASTSQTLGMGMEFIRTRAVDKVILARAKSAFFFTVALVGPLAVLVSSLGRPDIQVSVYGPSIQRDCLSHVPGSTLARTLGGQPNLISIPSGHILIGAWHVWEFLVVAVAIQVTVYLIYPFRHRRSIFWVAFTIISFAPLLAFYADRESTPWDEHLFFCFAANEPLFWASAICATIAGQLWCERRFRQLEH